MSQLDGKIALITGSTSGIGEATANLLAARGAHVVVAGRNEPRGTAVVRRIRDAGGRAAFVRSDLQDESSARALVADAEAAAGGPIDILVNNAAFMTFGPSASVTEETLDSALAVNVKVPFLLTSMLAPAMAERGGGAIVNVSTMAASIGLDGMALYGGTKAAMDLITKSWAAEYGPRGVRVNAVAPGPTRTPGTDAMGDSLDQLASLAPAGRVADPREIALAIGYLVGDDAAFVHGTILAVDGGRTAA